MKRPVFVALVVSIPFLLVGTVLVTTRHTALAAEARRLESSQEEWVDANARLSASISVLSSRERIAAWAEKLGLRKAKPAERTIVLPPASPSKGAAESAGGPNG